MTVHAANLRGLPATRIIAAVADACERWADADFPPRVRATRAIMDRLEYSEPVVDFALDRLFRPVTTAALRDVIDGELGNIAALDGFINRPHRPGAHARPAGQVTIVSSDTTIGVALWPALFALCAKCTVDVKDREDGLLAAFAQTLYEEDERFREAFGAGPWEDHEAPASAARLRAADVVVAFGRADSLAAIRSKCGAQTQFFGFGHRTSAALVEREALADERGAFETARGLANDALLYDGEGCLSVHAVFVEDAGTIDPNAFATLLHRACEAASVEFPSVRPLESVSRVLRNVADFRSAQSGAPVKPARDFFIAFDPPRYEPPPLVPRSIALYAVSNPEEAVALVQRHALPLEAFALADPASARPDAIQAAVDSGAARVGRIGRLQSPELESNHGGAGRISPFIRWTVRDR